MRKNIAKEKLESFRKTILDKYDRKDSPLMQVLQDAQNEFGYIPIEVQELIGESLRISTARINGVVSFYSMFSMLPNGKHIVGVCMGTACYVKGAEKVLHKILKNLDVEKGDVTQDKLFTVRDVRCIGACGLAPILTVGEKVFGKVTENMVDGILNEYKEEL